MRSRITQSKFMDIAETIMEQIIDGTLAPGDKVPSVRETAMKMGVTPNTAANAHAHLRNLAIIEPVHGSGSTIQPNAPKLCRSYIYKKFTEHELPVLQHRVRLLGLSEEKLMRLLHGTGVPDND